MFFPGETVTHEFIIPFSSEEISKVIVSYKQNDHIVLEKEIASSDIISQDTNNLSINHVSKVRLSLTESESLLFSDNTDFTIQLNVFTGASAGMMTRHVSYEMRGSSGIQHVREVRGNG